MVLKEKRPDKDSDENEKITAMRTEISELKNNMNTHISAMKTNLKNDIPVNDYNSEDC